MRIQHNIMSISACRNYTNNVSAMKKSLEKLSSGYRINRAGDDAAGLAISEKMRTQITGLETAQKNAKDGISLVQTAEGALTEVHDMLNRMVELATQSANGTYDSTTDRAQMQKEVDRLRSEINRIADSSNFNGINLLDGSLSASGGVAPPPVDVEITRVADGERGMAGRAGEFRIDLTNLTATMNAGAITDGTVVATLTLAGVTLGSVVCGALTAGDNHALTNADLTFTAANAAATIGGLEFDIAAAGNVITITGKAIPLSKEAEAFYKSDLRPGITWGAGVANHSDTKDLALETIMPVRAHFIDKYAQGEFKLTDDMIKDGASITILISTYVFKVGTNGKGAATASNTSLIDLSNYEEGDKGIAAAVARKMSQIGHWNFHIQTIGKDGTVCLTEKSGGFNQYNVWDLQGTKENKRDAPWTRIEDGLAMVRYNGVPAARKPMILQIGDTANNYDQLKVNIEDMHSWAMDIDDVSVSSQDSAAAAIDKVRSAINYVSDVRGTLGATQNRLEHTVNNLGVMIENIQDAESTIRDVDVADEMMAYTKNSILIQSAQAMLAQANQVPQGVLQLLA